MPILEPLTRVAKFVRFVLSAFRSLVPLPAVVGFIRAAVRSLRMRVDGEPATVIGALLSSVRPWQMLLCW